MRRGDMLQTPHYVWGSLGEFDLDPCAGEKTMTAKENWWIGRGEDGLSRDWYGFVWCNPPFSQKDKWISKMIKHNYGIMILPERASAPWFGPLAETVGSYFILGKKVNFVGGPSSNNLGSVLFPFGTEAVDRILNSGLPGLFVEVKKFIPRECPKLIRNE